MVHHRLGHMAEVYLTVVAIMLVGAALDAVLRRCQKSAFPWKVMSSDESRRDQGATEDGRAGTVRSR